MSDKSVDEFLLALTMLDPVPELKLEYRLHYRENGDIYLCTMQDHPANTEYIVVSKDEYETYYKYRVVNKQLKLIEPDSGYRAQLKSSKQGHAVVLGHAAILLEPTETYTDTEYYDYRNS